MQTTKQEKAEAYEAAKEYACLLCDKITSSPSCEDCDKFVDIELQKILNKAYRQGHQDGQYYKKYLAN